MRDDRGRLVALRPGIVLIAALTMAGISFAQSQSAPADATPTAKPAPSKPKPKKVYTDEDMATLPREGVSVTGSATPQTGTASAPASTQTGEQTAPTANAPEEGDAKAAAYWRGRFTTARQKLADDEKALPVLQNKVETERVNESSANKDSGQIHSTAFLEALQKFEDMKTAIANDKQTLNDLQEEFRHAGGQPGWIR